MSAPRPAFGVGPCPPLLGGGTGREPACASHPLESYQLASELVLCGHLPSWGPGADGNRRNMLTQTSLPGTRLMSSLCQCPGAAE